MVAKRIYKRLTKRERLAFEIPAFQNEALIGLLLGDGFLSKLGANSNARFGFVQSGKSEKNEYFSHVFNLFTVFCTKGLVPYFKTFTRKGSNVVYTSVGFVTMRLPCFNLYYELFYLNGMKIVPYNIFDLLTPVSLAYFIMDDGSLQGGGLHLNVYGFDTESVARLMAVLQDKFGLKCTIHKHKSHGMTPRIYILASSMDRLRTLVMPYMLPSMKYKLGV